jgi:Fe-S-cluster containining protein
MIPTFKCAQCGACCRHIRGRISKEDKAFLNEYAYGKMPLVQLHPVEKISFPLWDWEAKRFKKWQDEAGIDAKIRESRAVFDLSTNRAIIVTYFMDADACPFLSNSKCLIYDKKRAYVCRLFPFNKGPFLEVGAKSAKEDMFGSCPALDNIYNSLPEDFTKMVTALNRAMPYEFLNAVQNDIVTEWANKTIVHLIRAKKIKAALNYPYKFLLKRINNAEKIDLTAFLVEANIYSREEMEKLIKRFDGNEDAREKINAFLGSK